MGERERERGGEDHRLMTVELWLNMDRERESERG